ncbi:Dyp-type peroxidase [Streptomyces albipurpureus]|uniref:Dyp-type peroxidase n=1 Tax=Streptomyces albipurpureus TaxID=2897419 RepID=A0ABT0UXP9_9ACTN|nr:Dyp-type peroxidase [Streptomyces sp. CWNU-1]MCM2392739.1 Dyp-type peroxidase [Streptomyces sp. CWNU-1]
MAVSTLTTSQPKEGKAPQKIPVPLSETLPKPYQALAALDVKSDQFSASDAMRELSQTINKNPEKAIGIGFGYNLIRECLPRSRQLRVMSPFAGDILNPAESHGDILIQLSGSTAKATLRAREEIYTALPKWRIRWHINGFRSENRTEDSKAISRNPFGFHEGFGNASSERGTVTRALIRADQGEPEWAVGGTYQVVRIIRLATELWDRDPIHEQEQIIGRRRNGQWLDGTPRNEEPNFHADPSGRITPLDSHVRRAAPNRRNPPAIVRQSYSYDRGNDDRGIIFSCFQQNLATGFEAVQRRLENEPMAKYLLTTGGGYYLVPPPGDLWANVLTVN